MSIKVRMKSYSFWVSLASAILLVLKVIGQSLGFSVNENLYNDIFTALCGVLVICGIIAPPVGKENSILPTDLKQQTILSNLQSNTSMPENKQYILNNEDNTKIEVSQDLDVIKPNDFSEDILNNSLNEITAKDYTKENSSEEQNLESQNISQLNDYETNAENEFITQTSNEICESENIIEKDLQITTKEEVITENEYNSNNSFQNFEENQTSYNIQINETENSFGTVTPNQSIDSLGDQTFQNNTADLIMDIPNSSN